VKAQRLDIDNIARALDARSGAMVC
jgi:hypothetical protein